MSESGLKQPTLTKNTKRNVQQSEPIQVNQVNQIFMTEEKIKKFNLDSSIQMIKQEPTHSRKTTVDSGSIGTKDTVGTSDNQA